MITVWWSRECLLKCNAQRIRMGIRNCLENAFSPLSLSPVYVYVIFLVFLYYSSISQCLYIFYTFLSTQSGNIQYTAARLIGFCLELFALDSCYLVSSSNDGQQTFFQISVEAYNRWSPTYLRFLWGTYQTVKGEGERKVRSSHISFVVELCFEWSYNVNEEK